MPVPKTWYFNELLASADLNALAVYLNKLVPVGCMLPIYDFNGTITPDSSIFKVCNGQAISDGSSPINGEVLPDMSNRYLVGFGTEGGSDIGSATWATSAVGNASHQADLEHTHTDSGHTHDYGTLKFKTAQSTGTGAGAGALFLYNSTGNLIPVARNFTTYGNGIQSGLDQQYSSTVDYYTAGGSGNTGTSVVGLSNSLSTTQSVQPRSIRVRWYIRYK